MIARAVSGLLHPGRGKGRWPLADLLALLAVIALVAGALALSASPASASSPPGAPSSVTVTRADGTLTASWPAVEGATGYHVTYSDDSKQSWSLGAFDHAGTSITISGIQNVRTYYVGVRARSAGGWGAWTNSPASGPHTPPTTPTPTPSPVPSPSPVPTPDPLVPTAPTSVTVTRSDGALEVTWPAVSVASSYHVTYALYQQTGREWSLAALNHESNSITISPVWNDEIYVVGVRARNSAGDSGWTNSPYALPFSGGKPAPEAPAPVTATRGSHTISATWPAVENATHYHVCYGGDAEGPYDHCESFHKGTSITWNRDVIRNHGVYYVGVSALNGNGESDWAVSLALAPWIPRVASVTVTRSDGALHASWAAAGGAISYHVTYSVDGTQSWSLGAYGHTGTSVEIGGVDNDKRYIVAVRVLHANGWGYWRNSDPVPEWTATAPAAPENLAVAPGAGFLDITWDASDGATGYDVRVKAQGSTSWTTVASDVTGTSHRYSTASTIDWVGVRAGNDVGESDWTDVSRLPPSDLLSTATGIAGASSGPATAEAKAEGGASGQSDVTAQAQLAAPVWGTITRSINRLKGELNLNWTHSGWATGYNIVCSDTDGWSWNVCGWVDGSAVNYTTVPSTQTKPIRVTHYRRGSGSYGTPGDYVLGRFRHYMVAIRAVNSNPADASPWVNSEIIRPISGQLRSLTYTRTNGQIVLSWAPNPWTTGYTIYCGTYDATQSPYVAPTTVCATLTSQDDTAARHSVTLTSWTGGGIDNTSTWDIQIVSTNKWGSDGMYAPLIAPNPSLTVGSVTSSGATLTVSNHTGGWWYQGGTLSGSPGQCTSVPSGSTVTLTGLEASTQYEYKIYSVSSCNAAALIASTSFKTRSSGSGPAFSVANVTNSAARLTLSGHTGGWWYKGGNRAIGEGECTAGPASFILDLSSLQSNTEYTYKAFSDSACATQVTTATFRTQPTYSLSVSNIGATTATLNISGHGGQWWYKATTGPDNTCKGPVAANTSYRNLSGLTSGSAYTYSAYSTSGCASTNLLATASQFTTSIGLTVSGITTTAATLTIDGHTAQWWYKATTGPDSTCKGPVAANTATKALSGLTAGNTYTYSAYSATGCADTDLLATAAQFTTNLTLSVSGVTSGGATLTLSGHTGGWWYQGGEVGEALGTCTSVPSGTTATLSGLDYSEDHEYKAYSATGCASANLLGTVRFTTKSTNAGPALTPTNVSQTTARLTLSGRTGGWWYRGGSRAAGEGNCTEGPSDHVLHLSDLSKDTEYTYRAYGDSLCGTRIASATFRTVAGESLAASNVGATSATLTISNHTAQWWYKADTGPDSTCKGPVAANTDTKGLTGLSAGTTYTYSAYSATGCADADLLATAAAFTTTP